MARSFKEIQQKAEDLIEQGREADQTVNHCQGRVSSASSSVSAAQERVDYERSLTDSEGNHIGDVSGASADLAMAKEQLAASQRALERARQEKNRIDSAKQSHIDDIANHNRIEKSNIEKLKQLQSEAFAGDSAAMTRGMIERFNEAERARVELLQSMGIEATPEYLNQAGGGNGNQAWSLGGFSALDINGQGESIKGGSGGGEGMAAATGAGGVAAPVGGALGSAVGGATGGAAPNLNGIGPMGGEAQGGSGSGNSDSSTSAGAFTASTMGFGNSSVAENTARFGAVLDAVMSSPSLTTAQKKEFLLSAKQQIESYQSGMGDSTGVVEGGYMNVPHDTPGNASSGFSGYMKVPHQKTVATQLFDGPLDDSDKIKWVKDTVGVSKSEAQSIVDHILRYTGSESSKYHHDPNADYEGTREILKLFDSQKLPIYNSTIYRGVYFPSENDLLRALVNPEGVWIEDGITSFSSKQSVAERFARSSSYGIVFTCRNNKTGIPVQHLSSYAGESEVLSPGSLRNHGWKIDYDSIYKDESSRLYYVDLEEL